MNELICWSIKPSHKRGMPAVHRGGWTERLSGLGGSWLSALSAYNFT